MSYRKPREPFQLGYSTNVHRGESLREIYDYLTRFTLPVKKRVFGQRPAGLELRLGIAVTRELERPKNLEAFRGFLQDEELELFSINGFPLIDFQAKRVKERVYSPPWTHGDRARWTERIARVFAALLPEGRTGSLSTLAGTYRFWKDGKAAHRQIADNYLRVIETLEEIEADSGKRVILAVEPEPDTTLESAEEVIQFVEETLIPRARTRWKKRHGSAARIERIIRDRFTVNLDTCHFSVLFRDPAKAARQILRAGIKIGKYHITNALRLGNPYGSPRGYEVLRKMHEPRFLHQFCGVDSRGQVIWRGKDLKDLPRKLNADRHPGVSELRTHFHVPLYLKRWKNLGTTQEETYRALAHAVSSRCCSHIVLETYTWPVLATEDRLIAGISKEYRWLLQSMRELGARV